MSASLNLFVPAPIESEVIVLPYSGVTNSSSASV